MLSYLGGNQVILQTTDKFSVDYKAQFWRPVSASHTQELFKPLNAELNPICHLLVLLGDLTFMGPCIVSIFQYISNKMQRYAVYLYLAPALHVSSGTSTQHRERIQLYLQHLVFVTPLLLSAAIVEELELVWVCCEWRTPPTAHSDRFQLLYTRFTNHIVQFQFIQDTNRQQLGWILSDIVNTVKCSWWWAKTSPETRRAD